jgi:hypothetical protein
VEHFLSFWGILSSPLLMITSYGDPCYGLHHFMTVKFICDKTVEVVTNMNASQVDVYVL